MSRFTRVSDPPSRSTAAGRTFAPDEGHVPGKDAVVVLGYDFWRNALLADPAILNSDVWINGVAFTVIGVVAPAFTGTDDSVPAFFVPLMMDARLGAGLALDDRAARAFIPPALRHSNFAQKPGCG